MSPLSIKKRSEDRNRAGDQTSQAAPSPRLCLTRLISSPFRESEGDLGMWSWCPRCLLARKARAWREGCGSWFGYCAEEIAPAAFRSTRLCQKECLFGNFSLFVFFCLFVPPSAYGNWCCKKKETENLLTLLFTAGCGGQRGLAVVATIMPVLPREASPMHEGPSWAG